MEQKVIQEQHILLVRSDNLSKLYRTEFFNYLNIKITHFKY